jgi:hypothetical protein
MKKFFITLLILIIAGGVVFYFGWIQIQIPSEGYAVLFSKTHGYDDAIIRPGEFVWRWQRLIPTNVTLHAFQPEIREHTVTVEGELPSGQLYAEYLQRAPDFSWEVKIFTRFTIRPDALPALVRDEHITPENLDNHYDSVYEKMESYVYPRILDYFETSASSGTFSSDFTSLEEMLREALAESFPSIEFIDIHVSSTDMPDIDLYRRGKKNYQQITDLEQRAREEEIISNAAREAEKSGALSLVKEYGKVLSEYPILMEYLELKGSFEEISSQE